MIIASVKRINMNIGTSSRQVSPASMRIFVFACSTLLNTVESAVTIASTMGPYLEQPENCTTLGNLKDPNIKTALLSSKTQSAWLPLRRVDFMAWKWLDGTPYGEQMPEAPGYDCALLRAGDQIIDDVACNKNVTHFICDVKDTPCSAVKNGLYKCFTINVKTYIVHPKKSTWYTARKICSEQNTTLASFHKTEMEAIKKRVSTELGIYDKAWIGLRRSEFKKEKPGGYVDQVEANWAPGQPCVCPDKECVIVNLQGTWEAANCSSRHPHLCYKPDPAKTKKPTEEPKNPTNVAAIVVPIVVVTLIPIAIGAFFFWRKKRTQSAASDAQDPDVNVPLQGNPNQPLWLAALPCCPRRSESSTPLFPVIDKAKEIIKQMQELEREVLNVMVFGLPGTGKSSLINSLIAAVRDEGYKDWCETGSSGEHSGRQKTHCLMSINVFKAGDKTIPCKITLWDCPGFMNDTSQKTNDMLDYLLSGSVPVGTHINKLLKMKYADFETRANKFTSEESRKIDRMLFVASGEEEAPEHLISAVENARARKGTPLLLVINKKDLIKGTERTAKVNKISKEFGLVDNKDRVILVSSYAKKTWDSNERRSAKIDEHMCKLWAKILNPIFDLRPTISDSLDEDQWKAVELRAVAHEVRGAIFRDNAPNKENPNILVTGSQGVGKSALINSISAAVDKGGYHELCKTGNFGEEKGHTTKHLKCVKLYDHLGEESDEKISFICRPSFWDSYGFADESKEQIKKLLLLILSGKLKDETLLPDLLPQPEGENEDRRIDVILLVIDVEATEVPDNLVGALREIDESQKNGPPVFVVVNKVDKVCKEKRASQILPEENQKVVDKVCKKLGIFGKKNKIHYLSCYTDDGNRNKSIDVNMCALLKDILDKKIYQSHAKKDKTATSSTGPDVIQDV